MISGLCVVIPDHPHKYNPHRRHSALEYAAPLQYERAHATHAIAAAALATLTASLPSGSTIDQGVLSPETSLCERSRLSGEPGAVHPLYKRLVICRVVPIVFPEAREQFRLQLKLKLLLSLQVLIQPMFLTQRQRRNRDYLGFLHVSDET